MSKLLSATALACLTIALQPVRGESPTDAPVPVAAQAADTLSAGPDTAAVELQPLIVSHSRRLEKRVEAPIAISTLTRRDLEETKANSLDQVLNQSTGVLMVDLGNEEHTMSIRQPMTTKSLFLYLEDGIPVRPTGVFNHNALIEVNMAGLDRVEVIRGPSSSLYGSEAIGGAINLITQKPSLTPTGKVSVQGNDIGYRRTDLALSHTVGKVGLAFGGLFGGRYDSPRTHNDFEKLGFNASATYQASDATWLKASATYVDYQNDMNGGPDSAKWANEDFYSPHTFTWRRVDALRTRLSVDHDWNPDRRTQGAIFHRQGTIGQNPSYRVSDDRANRSLAHGNINENSVESIGAWSQHEEKLPWLKTTLTGGLYYDLSRNTFEEDYIRIAKDTASGKYVSFDRTDSAMSNYRVYLTNAAGYAQFKVNPIERLGIVGALRYDHFLYDYSNKLDRNAFSGVPDQEQEFSALTPKLGATYDFGSNRGVYANYSQGFSPPQISELYRGVKVPLLEPSYFHNYEVGAWYSWSRKFAAEMNAYYIEGEKELVNARLPDGTTQTVNSGRTGHRGVEAGFKVSPWRDLALRLNGAYSEHEFHEFQDGPNQYGGNEMNQAPNWVWNTGFTYKPSYLKGFRLGMEWQRVGEYWMDPANTRKYEGFDLLHLRLAYTIKGVEAWLNVHNLTDARYATSASFTPGTGGRPNRYSYNVGEDRSINLGLAYHLDWAALSRGRP
jgi:TonB-dependent siderophore receptor